MQSNRILSIDIFRGLTIFLMVFVNDLAGVSNIPRWMKHVAADVNGMTFVDVVFPAFLFIVGMAIPFAVDRRLAKGEKPLPFWLHVLKRTFALLLLGVYMVNTEEMNAAATLIPKGLWATSFYIAAIILWNRYPSPQSSLRNWLIPMLKGLAIGTLVVLFMTYRKGEGDGLTGMTTSWWGILGLIGWAYCIAMVLYKISGKNNYLFAGLFTLLTLLYLGMWGKWGIISDYLNQIIYFRGHFAHTLLVLSGIACSLVLRTPSLSSEKKIRNMLALGILLGIVGYGVLPFEGISKIRATPSWVFYSAAICCGMYTLLYVIVDRWGKARWANFLKPAGENPLLTYLLPPLFYAIVGYAFVPTSINSGILGFLKAVLFSVFILAIARWLTAKGIRLQL